VIVVYKVDRLTRSLLDFAKIVDRLDTRGVSFVSVTQAFNTTTSMGRLTLNVLLSFAQFEREVTGDRIRDKIAASKAKGMWMGGNVPLGYDLGDRRLVVNPAEAAQVRHIFTRYVELKSTVELVKELRRDEIVTKCSVSRDGRPRGGIAFRCGALCYLLKNRLYLGEVVHLGVSHEGEHEGIVERELFNAVQDVLAANRQTRRGRPARAAGCPLAGVVRDSDGQLLTTSFSYGRGGRLYRYYVVGSLDPSRPGSSRRAKRVPAAPLEQLVLRAITRLLDRPVGWAEALPLISAVELHDRSVQLLFDASAFIEPHEPVERTVGRLRDLAAPNRLIAESDRLVLIVDRRAVFRGGKANGFGCSTPAFACDGLALVRLGHCLLEAYSMSPLAPETHARANAPPWQRQRRIMTLGLLAPRVQKAIFQGTLFTSIDELLQDTLPLAWADQILPS
ncbi:MAG TPA: recombinase family protein, partial [Sphingomicrobium sp.]|nr:recombinase family protein [Sphingomicrobium sp.]